MISLFLIPLALAFIVLIWLDTDAPFEYYTLFGLKGIPWMDAFVASKAQGNPQSFIEFLTVTQDNFFGRLLTCPKCLSTWLGGVTGLALFFPILSMGIPFLAVSYAAALPYLTFAAYKFIKH